MAGEPTRAVSNSSIHATLDLLNVQRERFQMERILNAAHYRYLLAYLQLRASVGEPFEAVIVNRVR